MNHLQLFIASLIAPKQLAMTRVLTIGKVIQYAFLLITGLTVFSFIQFSTGMQADTFMTEGLEEYLTNIKWLIYPFAFIFIFALMAALTFLRISIYAVVGMGFVRMWHKRGEYRQVWRTATFAMTWATILSIVAEVIQWSGTAFTLGGIAITVLFLALAIQAYPQAKK